MDNKYVLESNVRDLITRRHAEQVLQSVKNYKVKLNMNNAMELIDYENSLNRMIKAKQIQYNEGTKLLRPLTEDEEKEIINIAENELKSN